MTQEMELSALSGTRSGRCNDRIVLDCSGKGKGNWWSVDFVSDGPLVSSEHEKGREKLKGVENEKQEKPMEVDEAAPHEASAEVQSSQRKVIRVESEETQDYVRETLAISQAEAEELGFVPSALGEPRWAVCWCDSRWSEKAIGYWQIASMVVEEGGEARTINLGKRGSGTSQKKCGYRLRSPDNAPCVQQNEAWQ